MKQKFVSYLFDSYLKHFLTSAEFPHGGKHHEQNLNLDLPLRKATGSSFFFGLLPINIIGNTYTAIYRNCSKIFFTHPPLPEVWPYSQNFWSRNFRFLTPHSLISRVKVHFECKLDYHFTYLLCLCKFYFSPTCLNYFTA